MLDDQLNCKSLSFLKFFLSVMGSLNFYLYYEN